MKTFNSSLAVVALLVIAVPASAGTWLDKTASWTGQGLGNTSGLATNASTGVLYYFKGTNVRSYAPGTDTWTDLGAAGGAGIFGYQNNFQGVEFVPNGGASGQFISFYQSNQIEIYDVATNAWSKKTLPVTTPDTDGINVSAHQNQG